MVKQKTLKGNNGVESVHECYICTIYSLRSLSGNEPEEARDISLTGHIP